MKPSVLLRPYGLVGTFLGSGLAPVAPGTAGSLAAIAFAALARSPSHWRPAYFAVLAAAFLLPAVWAAARCAVQAGEEDPPEVVIDEALGQWPRWPAPLSTIGRASWERFSCSAYSTFGSRTPSGTLSDCRMGLGLWPTICWPGCSQGLCYGRGDASIFIEHGDSQRFTGAASHR